MRTSSQSIMPAVGWWVVNGYGATSGVARVRRVSSRLLPELGGPTSTTCPAPCRGTLYETPPFFLCFSASTSAEACLILVFSSAWSFSLALCFGNSAYILRRHASLSSGVCAFLYSASASRYCGVRLAAIGVGLRAAGLQLFWDGRQFFSSRRPARPILLASPSFPDTGTDGRAPSGRRTHGHRIDIAAADTRRGGQPRRRVSNALAPPGNPDQRQRGPAAHHPGAAAVCVHRPGADLEPGRQ